MRHPFSDEKNLSQGTEPVQREDEVVQKGFIMNLPPADFLVTNPHPEDPFTTPKRSISSVEPLKRPSPKRFLAMQQWTRSDIEAARHASVLRSEERQQAAFENRMNRLEKIRREKILESIRCLQVRKRKEQMYSKMKEKVNAKQKKGVQRSEEARLQIAEKARRKNCQVDEVVFIKETTLMEKQLLMERKLERVRKQVREKIAEKANIARKRNEAVREAVERRKELLKEKAEQDLAKAEQRKEKEKKIMDMKEQEMQSLRQRSETWGRRVQQQQVVSAAGIQALMKKLGDKALQSELILKARNDQIQEKIKLQAQKLREAKERRNRSFEVNFSYRDVMSSYDTEEEGVLSQKLVSALEASQRHFKSFSEGYQKKCSLSQKELSRSKMKNAFARLSSLLSYNDLVHCRGTLADIAGTSLTPVDHEYIRHSTLLELITRTIVLSQKNRLLTILKEGANTLILLLRSGNQGVQHAVYFVRSGLFTQLIISVHEEANAMRKNSLTATLGLLLGCVMSCMEVLCSAVDRDDHKAASARDLMMNEVEGLALDRIYFAILKMCLAPKDLELTYIALRIISVTLSLPSRNKGESNGLWHYCLAVSLFALLQNIITGGAGNPKVSLQSSLSTSPGKLTCSQLVLIFCALRQLNVLARKRLLDFQRFFQISSATPSSTHHTSGSGTSTSTHTSARSIVPGGILNHGNASNSGSCPSDPLFSGDVSVLITRMELFHFFRQFFQYIHKHWCDLEDISLFLNLAPKNILGITGRTIDTTTIGGEAPMKPQELSSFSDAERFGLTLPCLPPLPAIPLMALNKDLYNSGGKFYHLRAALHECILLIGYLCLDNAPVQEVFSWGKDKPLLEEMLNAIPFPYFANGRHILFPTILCIIDHNDRNLRILQNVVDAQLLLDFLEEEKRCMSKKARQSAATKAEAIRNYRNALELILAGEEAPSPSLGPSFSDVVGKENTKNLHDPTTETVPTEKEAKRKSGKSLIADHLVPVNDKEMLFKSLKAGKVEFSSFFKLEKRMPPAFWPLLSEQIQARLKK